MAEKIKLDDEEYSLHDLSELQKEKVLTLQFVSARMEELRNHKAILQRAKNSYLESLKREMIAGKGGLLFEDN